VGGREQLMTEWQTPRTWRPVVMGRRGAVVSNHPLASEAGLAILRQGGNAVDAYLAVASTLGVVEPHMSGIGGEGFALVYSARDQHAWVVNGSGCSPRAATADRFAVGIPARGPITTITPGLVAAWCEVHARWGSLPLATVLDSAIFYAREGFGGTQTFCRAAREY